MQRLPSGGSVHPVSRARTARSKGPCRLSNRKSFRCRKQTGGRQRRLATGESGPSHRSTTIGAIRALPVLVSAPSLHTLDGVSGSARTVLGGLRFHTVKLARLGIPEPTAGL